MKLHLPVDLRKGLLLAVCAFVGSVSAYASTTPTWTTTETTHDIVKKNIVDGQEVETIIGSADLVSSLTLTNESLTGVGGVDIWGKTYVQSGVQKNYYVMDVFGVALKEGGEQKMLQGDFTLELAPGVKEMVVEAKLSDNGGINRGTTRLIAVSGLEEEDYHTTNQIKGVGALDVTIKPSESSTMFEQLTLRGNTVASSAAVINNVGLVTVDTGSLTFELPSLLVDFVNVESPQEKNLAQNGITANENGRLGWTGTAAVQIGWNKTGDGAMHFSAVSACGIKDTAAEGGMGGSAVSGANFNFKEFSVNNEKAGDVVVNGIFANMAKHGENKANVETSSVAVTMTGDVCIGGENASVTATDGRADFTAVKAAEGATVKLNNLTVSKVTLKGNADSSCVGLRAATDASITATGHAEIRVSAPEQGGKAYSVIADGGKVELTGSGKTRVLEGDILATSGELWTIAFSGSNALVSKSDVVNGSLPIFSGWAADEKVSESTGAVTIDFDGEASSFTGISTTDGNGSKVALSFTNGAQWNMVSSNAVPEGTKVQECHVSNLIAKDAHIYVGSTQQEWTASRQMRAKAAAPMTTFTIDNLQGNNTIFYLRMDLDTQSNDKIVVNGQGEGTHMIRVRATGAQSTGAVSAPLVTQSAQSTATFSLYGDKVDIGTGTYTLNSRQNAAGTTEFFLDNTGVVSPTGEAVMAFTSPSAQTSLALQNLSDLRSRLGEIRNMESEPSGAASPQGRTRVYAQALSGHDLVPGFDGHDYRSNFYGAKVGFTRMVGKRWIFGFEGNVVEGKQRLQRPTYLSKAESESFGLMLTGTWTNEKGSYCDVVLGIDRYEQDLNTWMLDGTPVSGTYTSFSPVFSTEFGHKFHFGSDGSWFIEPQAQLIWYMAGGDDYTTSNGMQVSRDETHSLTGRVGAAFGKRHNLRNGDALQWHVDAGVKHEFMGEPELKVNGARYEASSLGTRAYYGVGADWWLNNRSRVYGSVQREEGGDYKSELNARVGYSFSF